MFRNVPEWSMFLILSTPGEGTVLVIIRLHKYAAGIPRSEVRFLRNLAAI